MKKDRLDNLLSRALFPEGEGRDIAKKGLQRLKRRLSGTSNLDEMLAGALAVDEPAMPESVADAALRRLRGRLEENRVPRWVPVFHPAYGLAVVAIIAAIVIVTQLLPIGRPGRSTGTDNASGSIFANALATRSEIIAMLPSRFAAPAPAMRVQVDQASHPLESMRLGALDTFSTKVCGESFARRIDGNRRNILASLSKDNMDPGLGREHELLPGDASPAPTRHEILLKDRLNRVAEEF